MRLKESKNPGAASPAMLTQGVLPNRYRIILVLEAHLGLDIYVGSLTRYYSGNWEIVAAKAAREIGVPLQVVRQHDPPDAIRDPEEVRPIILRWREGLAQGLAKSLSEPLDWDEASAAPYFTDKPAWDGYQGLLLWAAYEEDPKLERPKSLPKDFANDPAIKRSLNASKTKYRALLSNVKFWLPVRLPFVFEAPDPGGHKAVFASSYLLTQELTDLNQRTWNMTDQQLDEWARQGCEYGSPLEVAARFGYAVFQRHARLSVMHRLPMLLDW